MASSSSSPQNEDLTQQVARIEQEKRAMARELEFLRLQVQNLAAGRGRSPRRNNGGSDNEDEHSTSSDEATQGNEFIDWLRTVDRIFEYRDVSESTKVKMVALKLRSYASTWWSNICASRDRKGKGKVKTWRKMKKLLKEKFLPTYYVQETFSKFHNLKQGSKSVEDYTREFEELMMKCDVREDDAQTLVRYLYGLNSQIANVVELQPYSTLEELSLLAHKVERQLRHRDRAQPTCPPIRSQPQSPYRPYITPQNRPHPPPPRPSQPPTATPQPRTPAAPSTIRHPVRCFKCHGLGHISSECPNRRVVTLVEYEESGEEVEEEVGEEEVHIEDLSGEQGLVGPDEGECLVLCRVLNGQHVPEEDMQREAIFHTRCTIKKRQSLFIDC